jgi:hypothetical protein
MKRLFSRLTPRGACGLTVLVTAGLLLIPTWTASAQLPYTATGWIDRVLAPPIVCTNASGQVLLRAMAFTLKVDSADSRLRGRRTVFADGYVQGDGSTVMHGTACHELGTWAGASFSPAGGIWELNWRGVVQPNCSLQHADTGYASGGAIEALRLEETTTRTNASSLFDPAVPFVITGVIKPAPLNTTQVVDNFDDNRVTGWVLWPTGTVFPLLEQNQQFTMRGNWTDLVTHTYMDTWNWASTNRAWSVANNRTLECRVELVSLSENATNAGGIVLWNNSPNRSYVFFKGRDFVQICKWSGGDYGGLAVLLHEPTAISNTNVILSLALTRVDPNVVVLARVLDRANPETVLWQGSFCDTPAVDPTLTSEELLIRSGMSLTVWPEDGPPLTSGDTLMLCAGQYTDGNQPEFDVTYDNLELRTSDIPPVAIQRAVTVVWPASGTVSYIPEWAPTPQGPWEIIPNQALPGMNQITVPASDRSRVVRLVQGP